MVLNNVMVIQLLNQAAAELGSVAQERSDFTAFRTRTKQELLALSTWNRLLSRDAQSLTELQAHTHRELTAVRKQLRRVKTIRTIRLTKKR